MTLSQQEQQHLTPRQIVAELDKFIIGQDQAKRAVAIAIRNRWRRQQIAPEIREEVAPKNIIMVGPTGVGKTEIARRLAALVGAPFVKIEATKFTEVGYVGRDVESMIRDLVERSVQMERDEQTRFWDDKAAANTQEKILDYLLPPGLYGEDSEGAEAKARYERTRGKFRDQLQAGGLEDRQIEIAVEEKAMPVNIVSNMGLDQIDPEMQNFFEKLMPSRSVRRTGSVSELRGIIHQQELDRLIDHDKLVDLAIIRVEQLGIVFLDELDKVAGSDHAGPDVSREGVQRDLLPIVEGSTVNTRYGLVHTDHILFVAAGAFTRSKPSDLMPELQGRFPIRVQLQDLDEHQFQRILTEPRNSLTAQQIALMATEGVMLDFTEDGVKTMAQKAFQLNKSQQNIGARRLYAVMEKVCEEISFDTPDVGKNKYVIDAEYVNEHLSKATDEEDLNIFGFAAGTRLSAE